MKDGGALGWVVYAGVVAAFVLMVAFVVSLLAFGCNIRYLEGDLYPEIPPTPYAGTPTPAPKWTPTPSNLAPAPTGLRVTAVTTDTISLRWDSVPDAQEYVIQRDTKSLWTREAHCFEWGTGQFRTKDTEFTDSLNVYPGRIYYYRVCARGDGTPYADWFGPPSKMLPVPIRRDDATTPRP